MILLSQDLKKGFMLSLELHALVIKKIESHGIVLDRLRPPLFLAVFFILFISLDMTNFSTPFFSFLALLKQDSYL